MSTGGQGSGVRSQESGSAKALILTFDRLPLSFLGCYGRSNAATPHFDRLAASSVVFDQHYVQCLDESAAAHAWQTGSSRYPHLARAAPEHLDVGIMLSQAGVDCTLIREDRAATPLPWFPETIEVTGRQGLDVAAEETPFFRLIEQAESLLTDGFLSRDSRRLLWLHAQGPPSDWRPPRAFARASLLRHLAGLDESETDEEPVEGAPIEEWSDEAFDRFTDSLLTAVAGEPGHDELTIDEWQMARAIYAGGIELIDEALGRLLAAFDEHSTEEPALLIVAAAAGMAVGERSMLALPATSLPEELVHAPLIVCIPNAEPGTRRQQLVQSIDLAPTLLDWVGVASAAGGIDGRSLLPAIANASDLEREFICLGNAAGATAIRTPDRYLVIEAGDETGTAPPPQLFVKPDDVWEVHEVAAQSPDEVDQLSETLHDFVLRTNG